MTLQTDKKGLVHGIVGGRAKPFEAARALLYV